MSLSEMRLGGGGADASGRIRNRSSLTASVTVRATGFTLELSRIMNPPRAQPLELHQHAAFGARGMHNIVVPGSGRMD